MAQSGNWRLPFQVLPSGDVPTRRGLETFGDTRGTRTSKLRPMNGLFRLLAGDETKDSEEENGREELHGIKGKQ